MTTTLTVDTMPVSATERQFGAWDAHLAGPPQLVNALDLWFSTTIEGAYDREELAHRAEHALSEEFGKSYDELHELVGLPTDESLDIEWEFWPRPNEFRNQDGTQAYFVTVFNVGQGYGGPEEGGWWFSVGTPEFHVPAVSYEEAERIRDELQAGDYGRTGKRSAVLGGDDYEIHIGTRPGKAFPETGPGHYE